MDFARGDERCAAWLERRSVVVMTGAARYEWTHGIARRKADRVGGFVVPRTRRVSLTFRASLSPPAGGPDAAHRHSRTE
jgi:hypothetical protein